MIFAFHRKALCALADERLCVLPRRPGVLLATVLKGFLLSGAGAVLAGERGAALPSYEAWSGVDATADIWLFYSGAAWAPWGGVQEKGPQLRVAGGAGGYRYRGNRAAGSISSGPAEANGTDVSVRKVSFLAATGYFDVLAGYLERWGPLTAKVFLGVSTISHKIWPYDGENEVQGGRIGPKGVAEFWYEPGERTWMALDLAWTSAHETGSAHLRSAYRWERGFSVGVEAALNSNAESRQLRGGLLLRWDWKGGEISVSGGGANEMSQLFAYKAEPYAVIGWTGQF